MNQKDFIQRFLIENANVRGELIQLTHSYQEITTQHNYPPTIKKLLGEALASATLLSALVKFKGRLTLQFQGKEPLKLVLAQCTEDFKLRGLVQWQGEGTQEEIMTALKAGVLAIIISQDSSTARYQGVVAWEGDSLATSLEGYFRDSEQLPTRLWLAVNETTVSGLLLQALPSQGTLKTQPVIGDDNWDHVIHLTNTITDEELLTLDPETLLHRLYSQEEVRVFAPDPVQFACTCSVEKSEQAILMLGQEEAEAELNDKQKIVVTCEFCGKEYSFDRVDVANLFKKNEDKPSQLH
jgi:molecular chaperone Hsp33